MRLINTKTLTFQEFYGSNIPPYAILSHRWRDGEEVSFQEFGSAETAGRSGATKIKRCAQRALQRYGLEWVWVDTCCINKESSAELTEAINSMWNWYWRAAECFVYLDDVHNVRKGYGVEPSETNQHEWLLTSDAQRALAGSEWFTRGWTLQELLAPARVAMYNSDWRFIGTKGQLADHLARITSIPVNFLHHRDDVQWASIAMRMSWASKRRTTREEDTAYSLLGLFGVNMPIIYGEERQRAFMRLQREIIDGSDDESIFAWRSKTACLYSGLLALSPSQFSDSGNVMYIRINNMQKPPYGWTNKGLELRIPGGEVVGTTSANGPQTVDQSVYYSTIKMRRLAINGKKVMQLACGFSKKPMSSNLTQKSMNAEALQRVIWIRLCFVDGVWQRENSHEFQDIRHGFVHRRDDVQDMFYVPQRHRPGS